jgi:hypothetical protein
MLPTPTRARPAVEALEDRLVPVTAYGLTTSNGLFTFDTTSPGAVSPVMPVTGLAAGDTLEAVTVAPNAMPLGAFPPFDPPQTVSQLLVLAKNGTQARVYQVDVHTAQATPVGSAFDAPGTGFDLAARSTGSTVLVTSDAGLWVTVNTVDGTVQTGTGIGKSTATGVVAAAYPPGGPGSGLPLLLGYDFANNRIGVLTPPGAEFAIPANLGGPTGIVAESARDLGMDSVPNGKLFASVRVAGSTNLYTIQVSGGTATLVGAIGTGADTTRDFALGPPPIVGFRTTGQGPAPDGGAAYSVTAGATTAVLPVHRGGDTSGPVSVNWSVAGGTAVPGVDFTGPTSGTLTFADGETDKTITLPLGPGSGAGPAGTIRLALSNPTRDAVFSQVVFPNANLATVTLPGTPGSGTTGGMGGTTGNPFAVPAGTDVSGVLSPALSSRRLGKSHNRRETVRLTNPTAFATGPVTVELVLLQKKGKTTVAVVKKATAQVAAGGTAVVLFTIDPFSQRVKATAVLAGGV